MEYEIIESGKEESMESYKNFLDRINSFEKKEMYLGDNYFNVSASISQKVDKNNKFQPFYGDTVVFNLDDTAKEKLVRIAECIYAVAAECFCEKLDSNTFHMTLHDLSNSPVLENIATDMFKNELSIIKKAELVCAQKIKMRSKFIFNMVNTSLVLGFYPVDEENYHKLMKLYTLFDDVKKLEYPLTPHITLGYYNIYGFHTNSARKLETIVNKLNENVMELELDTRELFYQKFVSMNEYINIFHLVRAEK